MNAVLPQQPHYNVAVFAHQVPVSDGFVKGFAAHKALIAHREDLPESPLLSVCSDSCLLQAIIYWCMLFGSSRNNHVHVSKIATDTNPVNFDADVSAHLGLSADEWQAYKNQIIHTRDTYASHRDMGERARSPIPDLTLAERTVTFWESWVRNVIRPDQLTDR